MAESNGILGALLDSFSTAAEHPVATLFIFVAVWVISFAAFAGEYTRQAYANMWRLLMAIVTAPFRFLRDIVQMLLRYDSDEQHYSGTKEYLLYKTCQLNYLVIFLVALFVLAGGIETALLGFVPQDKLEERKYVAEGLKESQEELKAAQKLVRELEAPTARASAVEAQEMAVAKADTASTNVEKERARLREAVDAAVDLAADQTGAVLAYVENIRSSSDGVPSEVTQALEEFFRTRAVNTDAQTRIRSVVATLYEFRKLEKLEKEAKLSVNTARLAVTSFDDRLKKAQDEQKRLDTQVSEWETKLGKLSYWRLALAAFDRDRLDAALLSLLFTVLIVVVIVWAGGISIDVLTWLTMMMVAAERYAARVDPTEPASLSSDDVTSLGRL